MRVLFGTVFFPAAEKYIAEFLDSLSKQSFNSFDLLIINDGISEEVVTDLLFQYKELNIIKVNNDEEMTPSGLRIKLLSFAKKNHYDLLIIGDSDDTFSDDRVISMYNAFCIEKKAFYYNDLIKEDGSAVFSSLPESVSDFREIGEYNFLGLSMISVNVHALSDEFIDSLQEYEGSAFDWYFVSRILIDGGTGGHVSKAWTKYRIYDDNFVGISGNSEEDIKKEIRIKQSQYKVLSKYSNYYKILDDAYSNDDYVRVNSTLYYWWNLTRRKQK